LFSLLQSRREVFEIERHMGRGFIRAALSPSTHRPKGGEQKGEGVAEWTGEGGVLPLHEFSESSPEPVELSRSPSCFDYE
jgi:hypothetical protein